MAGSHLAGLFCSPEGTSPAPALGLNDSFQQGCEELLTPFTLFPRPWSALRVKEYGYTRLHILNGTHVHIQQVSDDQVSEQWPDPCLREQAQCVLESSGLKSGLESWRSWVQILPLLLTSWITSSNSEPQFSYLQNGDVNSFCLRGLNEG